MRSLSAVLLALLGSILIAASPAQAEWKKATSPNFVVYSDGDERTLRAYVQELESFDRMLRFRHRQPLDQPAARPLPIYLVGGIHQLRQVWYGAPEQVAGFYSPTSEGTFAVAIRQRDFNEFLRHEYAHHFFFNLGLTVPAWLHEGLAEYYMTAKFEGTGVMIGNPSVLRAGTLLNFSWLPLEDLLTKSSGQILNEEQQDAYYPVAWALTHWFMSDPERSDKLWDYMRRVNAGENPARAMEQVTGQSLTQLRATLGTYVRGKLQGYTLTNVVRPVEVKVERLGPSADALLLLNQKLIRGTGEARGSVLAEVRRRAERFPDDRLALFALGHAGLHFGDREGGMAALRRLLERFPDDTEAMQFLALGYIEQARDEPARARELLPLARAQLVRAVQIDPNDYRTYALIGRMRQGEPGYPSDNDLQAWRNAWELAPEIYSTVVAYGSALMLREQFTEAEKVLLPLANHPHARAENPAAELLKRARAKQPPPDQGAPRQPDGEDEAAPKPAQPPAAR